jgi:hypothetical protein
VSALLGVETISPALSMPPDKSRAGQWFINDQTKEVWLYDEDGVPRRVR